MAGILLIEDETNLVHFIRKGLVESGFDVSVAFNGKAGMELALSGTFSLIILDIMLPDKNGIDICQELRYQKVNVPIIFLTALNTPENVAYGLNSGADDYLSKPFKFNELLARIHAVLRRSSGTAASPSKAAKIYTIANLSIDDQAKTVKRGEESIKLTATEYKLLLVLIKNKGNVLSRVDLLEAAWDITFNLGTNVVDVYVNYLRKKIDSGFEPKLIHTIIGMGYVMKVE